MTPAEPPRAFRSAPISRLKSLLFLTVFVIGVVGFYLRPKGSASLVRVEVRKGSSTRETARELEDKGLISSRWSFLIWAKVVRRPIRPGVYEVSPRQTGWSIYHQLIQGPPKVRLTFPEGWTARQMAALLETRGVCPAAEFLALVNHEKREGFLFPDTYYLEQGLSPGIVVSRLIERFHERVPKDFQERARAMKLSYGQLVTLASIVEREAEAPQERTLIAGVFFNRLRKHRYLESCATVEYALGAWKPRLTYKDLSVESPYNTYRHAGLPPGPICNPGAASLDAAAHPAQTDMMFFVADGQGTHKFSKSYNEHLAVQKRKK